MPENPYIGYSPLLTENELELLSPLAAQAADLGVKFGGTSKFWWIPFDNDKQQTVYCLSTDSSATKILSYYNAQEIANGQAEKSLENDVAFSHRAQPKGNFSIRTRRE